MHKLIWPIAFIAAFAVPVYARAQAPQELTFKVTPTEVDVIAKGLESQPYKDVVPLLQKLREQFVAQQTKQEPAPNSTGHINNNTGVVTQGQKGDNVVPIPKEAPLKKE